MEIVGIALPLVILIGMGYFLPSTINRQKGNANAHGADRFSAEMRVLDSQQTLTSRPEGRSTVALVLGGAMKETRQLSAENKADLRKARASRMQRVEQREAAAQRRLTIVIVEFSLLLVMGSSAAVELISFWWLLLPGLLLGATLVLGTKAARQGQRVDAYDQAVIAEIKKGMPLAEARRLAAVKLKTAAKQESQEPQKLVQKAKTIAKPVTDRLGTMTSEKATGVVVNEGTVASSNKKPASLPRKKMTPTERKLAAQRKQNAVATTNSKQSVTAALEAETPGMDRGSIPALGENELASLPVSQVKTELSEWTEETGGTDRAGAETLTATVATNNTGNVETAAATRNGDELEAAPMEAKTAQDSAGTGAEKEKVSSDLETAPAEKKPVGTVMPMPVPTYQLKPMIQRRDVDTSALLSEQTELTARVPYRPREARPFRESLTTAQLALPEAVNVEEILDNRRVANY